MSYLLWKLDGGKPVFVGADERPEGLDVLVRRLPKGTVIAKARAGVVNASNGSEAQLKLFRTAVAEAWRSTGGAPPAPLPVPTEAPTRRLESLRYGRGKRREEEADEDDAPPAPAAPKPAKVSRPVAVRPPLIRRRTTSVASGTLTSTPVGAAAAGASTPTTATNDSAPLVDESAELQLVRERATTAESALERCRDDANVAGVEALREAEAAAAKIAGLQRLLGQVTDERDAYRDRIEAQARAAADALAQGERAENEIHALHCIAASAECQRDELHELLSLALSTGLATATEARAETATVLRQSGELSRQLGAAREELDALRAAAPAASVPASALLDEVLLARIATEAARRAVRATRDDLRLRALAATFPGGVDELERLALGYADLLRQTGSA